MLLLKISYLDFHRVKPVCVFGKSEYTLIIQTEALICDTLLGQILRFWKGGALYVGRHVWPKMKILGFRWHKKGKNNLKNYGFLVKYFLQYFHIFSMLYITKACQWSLINFSKFTDALIRKEKKLSYSSQREKKKWEKLEFVL